MNGYQAIHVYLYNSIFVTACLPLPGIILDIRQWPRSVMSIAIFDLAREKLVAHIVEAYLSRRSTVDVQ